MADDMGEKTEAPTPRRLSEARQKGQIAKSMDLSAAVDLIGATIVIAFFGFSMLGLMGGSLRRVLDFDDAYLNAQEATGLLFELCFRGLLVLTPILLAMALIAFLAQLMQVGFLLNTDAISIKMEKLNPIQGLQNQLGRKNLVKSILNTIKLTIVLVVGWLFVRANAQEIAALPALPALSGMAALGWLAVELAAWLLTLLLIIGVADYLFQRWQHTQDLRMTKDQVKDERRSMDGDPQLKARRLRLGRQMAMQRVGQQVPKADVIVTNPTHYAVAIRYDEATMRAPRVVAKGVDFMAQRIRQVGMIHKVPIVERPPLARALHASVQEGQEISPEFYEAVAEVLAFVYRLEKEAAA